MPRLTEAALFATRPVKKFTNYKTISPYRIVLPPVLGDSISSKKDKSRASPCLQELSVMFTCWKKNDFIESKCSKEMEEFNQCVVQANVVEKEKKEAAKEDSIGGTSNSSATVNKLLRKYPQTIAPLKVKL